MGTLHHLPARSIAVFVSPAWRDQAALRLWAKLLADPASTGNVKVELVLITDEASDGNSILARQLRCSGVVCAVVRLPTVLRSQQQLDEARSTRDTIMAKHVDLVWDFGGVFVGWSPQNPINVVPMDPL